MQFTGERFIPTEQGKIRLEHYHRYAAITQAITEKKVLDVACGEGYGSSFMADFAISVTGVDISEEAINHASEKYKKENLVFIQGSATQLHFPDNSFEVVVSFETIEHLAEQSQMLAELHRVLRPDGILIISSPNRPIYSEESGEHNEFHVKELDFKEFNDLLKQKFPKIQYFGQRIQMGSVIQSLEDQSNAYAAWHDNGNSMLPKAGKMVDPVYFMAICCGENINFPDIGMSILYPDKLDLVKHYVGFAKWAQTLDKVLIERDQQLAERDQQLDERAQQLVELNQRLAITSDSLNRRAEWALSLYARPQNGDPDFIQELQNELKNERIKVVALLQSHSWRLTRPLRELSRWVSTPKQQAVRYTHKILQFMSPTNDSKKINLNLQSSFSSNYIDIPSSKNPIISIIIPIYGKIEYTLQCLRSIELNPPKIPFEIIIVDDFSTDNSYARLSSQVKLIKLIRNEKNQGFIKSCNNGANVAKGNYLLFLNNDTEVTSGWADALVRTFIDFPGTGFVGSKLVYPDGSLQEAGGIIWSDGSAWNFGRNQNKDLPIYNYAREVDYCSGASIMVPKSIFDKLGGFDEHYLPAYCEDCDLALSIRENGYRVIYQPHSVVIHHEGITSGTDTTSGAKAYQVENTKKLFNRWKEKIEHHQISGVNIDAAKDRRAKHRVLVLDACTPTPNQDAGSLVAFNFMLLLREMDFQVTFVAVDNFLYLPEYTKALQSVGVEVLYSPYINCIEDHLIEYGSRYQLAFLFRPDVVHKHLESIRVLCPNAKVLYSTVDLHFIRMAREAELQSNEEKKAAAEAMKVRELSCIQAVDAAIVHSTSELELLRPILPNTKIFVFPLIMDIKRSSNIFSERNDIVFVGGYQHTPNIDAVKYFVSEVMPLLRKKIPGVRFHIVGSKPPTEIQSLACDDVVVVGFVEDLNPLLNKMRISVAPLRYGAGIKGKIGTSMALGLPVVATTLAAEGMSLTNGENILVADGPLALSEKISEIYKNEELWEKIRNNGFIFIEKSWGAEATWKILANIVSSLGIEVTRSPNDLSLFNQEN